MKEKIILLVDGNALIHRGYHAVPPLTTRSGELINAAFGFTAVLLKAIKDLKPDYVAVAFDKKGPTFRHKIYKDYKATRPAGDIELYKQFPRVIQIVEAFNIPHFEVKGYEADDIIGALTQKNAEVKSIIVTGDMDALQLVNNNCEVYAMKKGIGDTVLYNIDAVMKRYDGLKPEQLVDYKALRGDPSDNIPGVPGVGEKTAIRLINEFGNIDRLYNFLEKKDTKDIKILTPRIKDLLLKNKDQALLSKRLAKIITDINFDFDLKACELKDYNREEVTKLFQELGFKSLLKRLPESKNQMKQVGLFDLAGDDSFDINKECEKRKVVYELIDSEEKFELLINKLNSIDQFAFDTETTSANSFEAELVGISFCFEEGKAYYVKTQNSKLKIQNQNLKLKTIFADARIKKIGHNLKYDLEVMRRAGIKVAGADFDTMLASYILNPGTRKHGLDDLAFSEFGYEMMSFEDLVGKGREAKKIGEVDIDKLAFYSCEDVDYTFRLYKKFKEKLGNEKKLGKVFQDIEMPLIPVLAQVERNGIKINVDFLKKLSRDFGIKLEGLESKIFKLAGVKFNVRSTLQLKEVLFDKLKIATGEIKKIKTGFSTAATELVKLRRLHPIISLIEEHRELTKLKNTYLDALPKLVASDGRLHTSFNQTITATGRLSSSEPNLQNIPIKTDIGQQIRKAFVAETGYKILAVDYSQIELRIMAHVSGDVNMIKAFEAGEDIHTATAAKIFDKGLKDISKSERRAAKTINFGIMYGMSDYGLSQALSIEREEAHKFINEYFEQFPSIAVYIKQTLDSARKLGYVETMFGRRRYLPELQSRATRLVIAAAERMAINMPIQGAAADIIKMAMIKISKEIRKFGNSEIIKMILQVHDELVFEVKEDLADEMAGEIKKIMENVYKLNVPLIAEASIGDNWGELIKIVK